MKLWDAASIREELAGGNKILLVRALLAIYNGQTQSEKNIEATTEHNGIGFNGFDAEILTSFAKQFLTKRWLSEKQYKILQKKMPKYAGQLERIAAGTEGPAVVPHLEEKPEVKTFTLELSEDPFTDGDYITFPNGATINFEEMNPVRDSEGEITHWELQVAGGNKYVVFND